MYDEERDEEARAFHRSTRDLWQPDGMSAPPDEAPGPALGSLFVYQRAPGIWDIRETVTVTGLWINWGRAFSSREAALRFAKGGKP